jgi:hypothetical protein
LLDENLESKVRSLNDWSEETESPPNQREKRETLNIKSDNKFIGYDHLNLTD